MDESHRSSIIEEIHFHICIHFKKIDSIIEKAIFKISNSKMKDDTLIYFDEDLASFHKSFREIMQKLGPPNSIGIFYDEDIHFKKIIKIDHQELPKSSLLFQI